jgi:hypothetical protein
MRGCITVLAMIVLLTPHHFKGGCWCLRNLRGTFGPFGYEGPGVLRRRLELGQGGPRAVRAGVQRINAQVIKRLVGTLLKFAVQWGPLRDIDPRVFLLARCGCCR